MNIEDIVKDDLSYLKEYTPENWSDITPRFQYFIEADFIHPIKLVENGQTVAIGTTAYHEDTAWLACIIVPPQYRNKGYGTIITKQLLENALNDGFKTISLDATDFGYPVYKKLGFELETEYIHFNFMQALENMSRAEEIVDYQETYKEPIRKMDQQVTGENRDNTILPHMKTAKVFMKNDRIEGFYMPELGDGLIIATTPEAGTALMEYRMSEKTYASLPVDNKIGIELIRQFGFEPVRTSRRMRYGKKLNVELDHVYNRISGMLC